MAMTCRPILSTVGYTVCMCLVLAAPVARPQQGSEPKPDRVKAGAELFAKSGCTFCHGPSGMGTERAPSLRDVHKRLTEEQIQHQIHDGGQMMPPFAEALTAEEIAKLAQFLHAKDAWKLVPPPGPAGK